MLDKIFFLTLTEGLTWYIIDSFDNLRGADLYKVPVSIAHFYTRLFKLKGKLVRYDPLYASLVLLGILGTFKAYLTLSDPGLFLSMIAIFPETYPCTSRFLLPLNSIYPFNLYQT